MWAQFKVASKVRPAPAIRNLGVTIADLTHEEICPPAAARLGTLSAGANAAVYPPPLKASTATSSSATRHRHAGRLPHIPF